MIIILIVIIIIIFIKHRKVIISESPAAVKLEGTGHQVKHKVLCRDLKTVQEGLLRTTLGMEFQIVVQHYENHEML